LFPKEKNEGDMTRNKNGYFKLHRSVWDNPVLTRSPDHMVVWLWLLSNAEHGKTKADNGTIDTPPEKMPSVMLHGKRVYLKRGQGTCGRKLLAKELGLNESKVYRILKLLENEQQIEQQTDRQKTLYTIKNWAKYQDSDEQQNEQRVNNERTTSEHVSKKLRREEEKKREGESNPPPPPPNPHAALFVKDLISKLEESTLKRGAVPVPSNFDHRDMQDLFTAVMKTSENAKQAHDKIKATIESIEESDFWEDKVFSPGDLKKHFSKISVKKNEVNPNLPTQGLPPPKSYLED